MDKYRIYISSPPDRENLVAEIFFEDIQWAEVNKETITPEIEIYCRPDGRPWVLPFDLVVGALTDAKARLDNRVP